MKYELTPMPLFIFHIDGGKSSLVWGGGSPRIIKNKSDLMNELKVMI